MQGYSKWSEYHTYLHSYELEKEYVEYCQELSKQLKVCTIDHIMKIFLLFTML
jgi:hypothetical protein